MASDFWTGELPGDREIRGTNAMPILIRIACDRSVEIGKPYRYSTENFAEMLGYTDEGMREAMDKLESLGLILRRGRTITVLEVEGVEYKKVDFVGESAGAAFVRAPDVIHGGNKKPVKWKPRKDW